MNTIEQFGLPLQETVDVEMPAGAMLLAAGSVRPQPNMLWAWAIVDDTAPQITRRFLIFGNGSDLDANPDFPNARFVGTVIVTGTAYQVFDAGEVTAPTPAEIEAGADASVMAVASRALPVDEHIPESERPGS